MASDSRNDLIRRMREDGLTYREIARRLDISAGAVSGVLSRSGMATQEPHKGGWNNGFSAEVRAMAIAWYRVAGASAVANKLGVHRRTINRWVELARNASTKEAA